jgi:hypothetical protein
MATDTWTDSSDNWSTAADWSGGVPTATSNVVVAQGDPQVTSAISVASLDVSGSSGGEVDFVDAGASSVAGAVSVDAGAGAGSFIGPDYLTVDGFSDGGSTLTIGGALTNSGGVQIGNADLSAASTVTATGLVNSAGATLTIAGGAGAQATLDITGATGFGTTGVLDGTVGLSGDALLEFAAGEITSIASDGSLTIDGADAFVADASDTSSNSALTGLAGNAGLLVIGDGASVTTDGGLTNTGTINLVSATLDIDGPAAFGTAGVLTGTVSLSGGALLEFAAGEITSIASDGSLTIAGGLVADASDTSSNSALTGLAGNAGFLSIGDGGSVATDGGLANSGDLYLDAGLGDGGSRLTIGGTLTNSGTVTFGNDDQYANSFITANGLVNYVGATLGSIAVVGYFDGYYWRGATLDIAGAAGFGTAGVLDGIVRVDSGLLEFASGQITTIASDGLLFLDGYDSFVADASAISSNSALTGLTSNAGTLQIIDGASVTTDGEISNTGGNLNVLGGLYESLLDVDAAAGFGTAGVLTGLVELSTNALLEFASGEITTIASDGTLTIYGADAFVADASDISSNSALTGLTNNEGVLNIGDGASVTTDGGLTSSFSLGVDPVAGGGGSTLAVGGALTNSSSVQLGNSAISAASTITANGLDNTGSIGINSDGTILATLDITGGTSSISGTISGSGVLKLTGGATTIASGATLSVATWSVSGAGTSLTIAANVSYAGAFTLGAGATLTVDAGETFTLDSSTTIAGSSVAGSGTLAIGDGATLTPTGTLASSVILSFSGAGVLDLGQTFAGEISQFGSSDTIDLAALAYKSSYAVVWYATTTGGTLQIIDTANSNAIVATLDFLGSYSGEAFGLVSDTATGTDIGIATAPYATPAPGDVLFTGVSGRSYSAYEQVYSNGTYEGVDFIFTNVTNQLYSAYAYDYSAGADFIGSKFYYTAVTSEPYTGYEYDYDGSGPATRISFTGVTGAVYSSYEYDFVGGVFAGSKFEVTTVPTGATYSSYELDYNAADAFTGDKFFFTNLPGQSYTGEEEDFDANGALVRVLLTGVIGQAYSSLEEDFSAGTYEGYKAYYTGITDQTYTGEEVDVSATNQLEKVVYTGMSSTPYSSVEEDFSAGALSGEIYDFTNVSGASAYAFQVEDNSSGVALQEIYDNNDGSHTIIGLGAANQTFTSIGDDTFTGGGANETFVFTPIYGADTITDFYQFSSGATHDTISLPTSEFANFAAVLSGAQNSGGNVAITAPTTGDTLTLDNMTTSALAQADFTFHT